jgi:hypothetical protein
MRCVKDMLFFDLDWAGLLRRKLYGKLDDRGVDAVG